MKILKKYQEEAVEELLFYSERFLKREGRETIVFQSPTGSGKTITISHFIYELTKNSDQDLCFLWISIGDGNLHIQSMKSVKREIGDSYKCSLLEKEFFGSRNYIEKNEIVFLNWQKINSKNKEGEFTNTVMKDSETNNFPKVLEETHKKNRKIILIIDESHYSSTSERAMEIRDEIIVPELTIEMSATPVLISEMEARVTVPASKVIDEGMIKKEIIINQDLNDEILKGNEIDSELLILESAYKKREELAKKYKEQGANINPLVLIQIPNSTAGDLKMESVVRYLESKGITRENGKLAVWLGEDNIDSKSDELLPLDGKFEYLIFKMAIDTGWDCPRAQILLKFRESNSIIFEIQTVGRIIRMPEAKHYLDEELNKAFVYSNIKNIAIKKEIYNPNIIKSKEAKRKDCYQSINLKSYYKNRTDYGTITTSFYQTFEHYFCEEFGIKQIGDNEITDYYINMETLREKGINTEYGMDDKIISDLSIAGEKIDKDIKIDVQDSLVSIGYSDTDLEIKCIQIIRDNLNGFAPKKSISPVMQAMFRTFNKYLGMKAARGGIVSMQNLIVSNENVFSSLISKATEGYKPIHRIEANSKVAATITEGWEILPTKRYNPETTEVFNSNLSLYQPLYMELTNGNMNQLECDFIKYLDTKEDYIDWFWKNGSEHMQTNFGIKKDDGGTFQPDFIIKFKDGRIGIFDTKAVGYNEQDNAEKSQALYKYIYEETRNGKNLIGGLVIKDNSTFKYFEDIPYKSYDEEPDRWKDFDSLF